jgi:glyoxylase-like metal-dependent hydrolase (beta-lactamase superfamily II)
MTVERIHHLNCAAISGLAVLGQHLVCHVLLLETSSAGLVLVDTGLGTPDYADLSSRLGRGFTNVYARPLSDPSLAAIAQIRALGFEPEDVRHIVQTHLDLDHVGGLSDFPWATVHVHEREHAAAMRRHGAKGRGRYRPRMWAHAPRWSTYTTDGDDWFGMSATRELPGLPDDIRAVPLYGHTLGHSGIAVRSDGAWMLDAGDAYFDAREVHGARRRCGLGVELFQTVVTTDYRARRENQDLLRAFAVEHPEVAMFCAHNPHEYRTLAERAGDPIRGFYASGREGTTIV